MTAVDLTPDCSRCFGLCCVALPFTASAAFAVDKAACEPCTYLGADFGCRIHDGLRQRGYPGCTVYECFGAGQHVSQVTFRGTDWRQGPDTRQQMFTVFPVRMQLQEMLWYLAEARDQPAARSLQDDVARLTDRTEELACQGPGILAALVT